MKMAAPNTRHQSISIKLSSKLFSFLENTSCQIFHAPFDVRLPVQNKKRDNEIITVVQPDLCIVCDASKIDERGCVDAPDIIIEILSPGNSKKEMQTKYELYGEAGVQEYWIVVPVEEIVIIHSHENGMYGRSKLYSSRQIISTSILTGLEIRTTDIFK